MTRPRRRPALVLSRIAYAAAQALAAAAMLAAIAALSLSIGEPILIPSLAAATFLQVLGPDTPAARPWPIVAGQLCGLVCGVGAVRLLGAGALPPFGVGHPLDPARAAAVVLAAGAAVLMQRGVRAPNAAGAALAATIALGDETATPAGAARALVGIALVALLGHGCRLLLRRIDPDRG